jgi:DNA-binding transcriptional LysR family regulator
MIRSIRFTVRQLEYFVATCDAGSVTKAAQQIPVAPSSISAALSQLEAVLGIELLIRHHARGVSPTPAGRRFLTRARAVLRDAEELERFASELTGELSGTLELGCFVPLAPLIAPRLCQTFEQAHAGVSVELVEAEQDELMARLHSGRLALALTYDLDLADDLDFDALAELPPRALFAADHPLGQRAEISLAELVDEPLVLLDLPHSRDYFRALFLAEGVDPVVARRSTHPEVIRTLVANGYGYTIINARPQIHQALDGRLLRTVPIAGTPRPMILGVTRVTSARPTRLTMAFTEHCRLAIAAGEVPGLGGFHG